MVGPYNTAEMARHPRGCVGVIPQNSSVDNLQALKMACIAGSMHSVPSGRARSLNSVVAASRTILLRADSVLE